MNTLSIEIKGGLGNVMFQIATVYASSIENNMLFTVDTWCKENFDFIPNKIFVDDLEDYEEIYLMSLCDNNIIVNSTFGWWGAWLNKNIHKKIIFPKVWFGPSLLYHNTSDIYIDESFKL